MPYAPGQKFGHLTIIERLPDYITPKGAHKLLYLCECDCEKHTRVKVTATHLASGHTTSCGCENARLSSERLRNRATPIRLVHGKYEHPIYNSYRGMIDRCYSTVYHNYCDYGGRGIKICREWYNPDNPRDVDCFRNFFNWSMINGWSAGLSIDRNNVDGDYCPENCSWESNKNQMNNRRDQRWIDFYDTTLTSYQLACALGFNGDWFYSYLHNHQFDLQSVMQMIETPYGQVNYFVNWKGDPYPFNAIYYLSPSGYVIPQDQYTPPAPQPALWSVDDKGFITGPYPEDPNYYPPIPSVIPNV